VPDRIGPGDVVVAPSGWTRCLCVRCRPGWTGWSTT